MHGFCVWLAIVFAYCLGDYVCVSLDKFIGACMCLSSGFLCGVYVVRGLLWLKHTEPYSVEAVENVIVFTCFEATEYVRNKTTGL